MIDTADNRVSGNFIGTNASGTAALVNTLDGVTIVASAQLEADPAHPGESLLIVVGTPGDDTIEFGTSGPGHREINVALNGQSQGTFAVAALSRIVAYGGAGNDSIVVPSSIKLPAYLLGEGGADLLVVGGGENVLVGGAGNDTLLGGKQGDLLIGGGGQDVLVSQSGSDIEIGGETAFDANLTALDAILGEWTSTNSYAVRIANLSGTGTGKTFASRYNGNVFLTAGTSNATVFDDDASDVLSAGGGTDWFFADVALNDPNADSVLDQKKNEVVTPVG